MLFPSDRRYTVHTHTNTLRGNHSGARKNAIYCFRRQFSVVARVYEAKKHHIFHGILRLEIVMKRMWSQLALSRNGFDWKNASAVPIHLGSEVRTIQSVKWQRKWSEIVNWVRFYAIIYYCRRCCCCCWDRNLKGQRERETCTRLLLLNKYCDRLSFSFVLRRRHTDRCDCEMQIRIETSRVHTEKLSRKEGRHLSYNMH